MGEAAGAADVRFDTCASRPPLTIHAARCLSVQHGAMLHQGGSCTSGTVALTAHPASAVVQQPGHPRARRSRRRPRQSPPDSPRRPPRALWPPAPAPAQPRRPAGPAVQRRDGQPPQASDQARLTRPGRDARRRPRGGTGGAGGDEHCIHPTHARHPSPTCTRSFRSSPLSRVPSRLRCCRSSCGCGGRPSRRSAHEPERYCPAYRVRWI